MHLFKKLIVLLCGRKKPCRNFDFKNVSSILIRPFGYALGDAMIHLAYARQLKSIYPHARLGVLVGRNRDIFAQSPLFDELVDDSFASYWRNRKKWQLMLDLCETFNTPNLIADAVLAPETVMIFSKQNKKHYNLDNISNYDFRCPFNPNSHVIEHLCTSKFAEYFDISQVKPELSVSQSEIDKIMAFWQPDTAASKSTIKILVAPQGSFKAGKYIPEEELAALLNRCNKEYLQHVRFIMCRTTNSEAYFNRLKSLCNSNVAISLSPPTRLGQYLALAASADIVIGVDSGTVHLACALKKPLLSFYANHNLHLWHPLPHEGVPHLMVVAPSEDKNSKETRNFPLEQAADWLNTQIKAHLA
ncbi:lipopolysaccharide core biosynthesis protein [Neisseria animaloris]|nr:hypothetical protein BWD08_09515 [Neisseria animaloris]VEH88170.1 lipopolysaccharide core biosynthesis protein [Neisseria animaloris]